jgi:hypothetical protein
VSGPRCSMVAALGGKPVSHHCRWMLAVLEESVTAPHDGSFDA